MSALDALLGPLPATDWPAPLPGHLSASQITMYQRCREQYRRRYVLGERERPGAALIWGSADHYAHEQNFAQKIESHTDLPLADVELAFAEGFDQAVERNGGESEVEWGSDKPADLKDEGTRLAAVYHRVVSPKVQPTAVELDFVIDVLDSPVPVIGRVDLETAGSAIERKTARKASSKVEPKWRIQGLIYQLARTKEVDYHISVKTKTPAIYTPTEKPDLCLAYVPGQVAAVERLVAHTARSIASDFALFGPDEPWQGALSHEWACSYCGWRKSCRWWGNS